MSVFEDPTAWLWSSGLWAGRMPYTLAAREYLGRSVHYLDDPPPQALFAIAVERLVQGLFGLVPSGQLVGLAVLERPKARALPQDGTWAEITRFVLDADEQGRTILPHGTASRVLAVAIAACRKTRIKTLIAYHDRSRHTGCIYKKAGFKRWGVTKADPTKKWSNRPGREQSGDLPPTSKRRWRIDL